MLTLQKKAQTIFANNAYFAFKITPFFTFLFPIFFSYGLGYIPILIERNKVRAKKRKRKWWERREENAQKQSKWEKERDVFEREALNWKGRWKEKRLASEFDSYLIPNIPIWFPTPRHSWASLFSIWIAQFGFFSARWNDWFVCVYFGSPIHSPE